MPYQMKLYMQQNSELFQEQLRQTLDRKSPQMSELTGSNHRCRAHFECAQTVVCNGSVLLDMDPTVCSTAAD